VLSRQYKKSRKVAEAVISRTKSRFRKSHAGSVPPRPGVALVKGSGNHFPQNRPAGESTKVRLRAGFSSKKNQQLAGGKLADCLVHRPSGPCGPVNLRCSWDVQPNLNRKCAPGLADLKTCASGVFGKKVFRGRMLPKKTQKNSLQPLNHFLVSSNNSPNKIMLPTDLRVIRAGE